MISLSPHLHTPFPPLSLNLISLVISMDVKHHVYFNNLHALSVHCFENWVWPQSFQTHQYQKSKQGKSHSSADTRVFRIPSFRTKSCGQHSFSYQAPLSGTNSLFLSAILPVSSFKSSLKTFLFLKAFSSVSLPRYTTLCVCGGGGGGGVCACMCVFVLYALNFENMCI